MSESKGESSRIAEITPRSARSDAEEFYEVAQEALSTNQSAESPLMKGMNLDLSLASRKDEGDGSFRLQEGSIVVNFELPDGSFGESIFKLGQTTEVLKSFVESEYGIPMLEQIMYIEEKMMMNPLSLVDFKEAKEMDEILIRVEGPLPSVRK